MKKYNVLILTDHTNHSKENSVYAFAHALRKHQLTNRVDIASRGFSENDAFFKNQKTKQVWATTVSNSFGFSENGALFRQELKKVSS